ncbi:MAG: MotA/TolQ/ExbB proton channel family protein [Desulfovermiculus sp.]
MPSKVRTKNILIVWIFFCCLVYGSDVWAEQAESSQIRETIQEKSGTVARETSEIQALLMEDRDTLQARLQELKESVSGLKTSLQDKKDTLQAMQEDEEKLRQDLESERKEVEEVQGSLVGTAKNLEQLMEKSPFGPLMSDHKDHLAKVADRQDLPGMDEVRSVVDCGLAVMDQSGQMQRFSGSYMDATGREQNGTLALIGGLTAMYHSKQGTGYLQPDPKSRELMAVGGDLPWLTKRSVQAYMAGDKQEVPVDISKGSVFAKISREQTWGEWFRAGGFLVWPLIGIAGLALVLVAERLVFMLGIRSNSDRIMNQITHLAENNEWQKCRELCAAHQRAPLCRVIGKALDYVGESRQAVENALQEGVLSQLPRLERFLPTLNVLAAIAPLLGLLGTVTGMISTFQAITIFGTGEPKVMAGGISEALITTQIGLGIAVPIMFLHHLLDRRVDKIIADIEEKGAAFSLLVLNVKEHEGERKKTFASETHEMTPDKR